jgi:DinB superfamily
LTLAESPSPGANPIAWLVWHASRVQDHHVAELINADQVWIGNDWARRFGLDPDPSNTGYGHSAQDVAAVRPERPEVLLEYLDAVDRRTRTLLESLNPAELDRIVDRGWDPPVTLGVRLVSIADDRLRSVIRRGQNAVVDALHGYAKNGGAHLAYSVVGTGV